MSIPDPIAEAEVLVAYGRKARAIALLQDASAREPDRLDIQARLQELTSRGERRGQLASSARDETPIVAHAIVAWGLFAGSMVLAAFLCLRIALPFAIRWVAPSPSGPSLLAVVAGVVLSIVLSVAIGATLFSLLWFTYLRIAVGVEAMRNVEERLRGIIALRRMDPIYGWIERAIHGLSPDR